ncbi:MAG: endo-1,4-beta-xylanase [Oscillospiraceae bacterium]|jgi:GH35 family endo-1,4-beta-xylanase|nr:endo-1,4-beta-xylanase [Oscillospiraceae bacterium]
MSDNYKHRRNNVRLRIVNSDGTNAARTPVRIKQTNHEFLFGCGAFDAVPLANGSADAAALARLNERMEKWLEVFNFGTLPFYWGRYEPEQGKPQDKELHRAAEWLRGRGVKVKGHPLCWHTVCAPWLMNYSNADILRLQLERIRRDMGGFAGLIDMWDVINEVVIMPIFDKYDNAITRVCKDLGRVQMIREVFAAAKETNPGATLLLNDFNTSIDYEILIDGCLNAGVPIDAIGIQSHQHQGYWGLEKLNAVLERFSSFGLPIHFTENTIISGDLVPAYIEDLNDWQVKEWPSTSEDRQAREMKEMYETLFAHPLVQAITTWDHTDGKWLNAPSGVLRSDNGEKPANAMLRELIKGEWFTEVSGVTDENGEICFEGYLGEYLIQRGGAQTEFTLTKTAENLTVSVQ